MRKRIEDTRKQRAESIKPILEGRPLDAEKDEKRKLARIMRITGFNEEKATKVANHDPSAETDLSDEERFLVETAEGKYKDFMSIAFLEQGRAAANTVARIVHKNNLEPEATGFMISDRLFMSNQHVFVDKDTTREFLIEFNYEMNAMNTRKEVTRFALAPNVFYMDKYNEEFGLDFAVVAVGERFNGSGELADFGFCPMKDVNDKHANGDLANIVQHPGGGFKQIALRKNQLVAWLDEPPVLHYYQDLTARGSSGAPIFNDQWELVGLHYGGIPTVEEYPDGREVPKNVVEGTRISAIVKALAFESNNDANNLTADQRRLIREALEYPFRIPSLLKTHELGFTV